MLKQGDMVIFRAILGKPLLRRVWAVAADGDAVAIHDEYNYERHMRDVQCLLPVCIPRTSVFVYDPATFPAESLDRPQDAAFWNELTPA